MITQTSLNNVKITVKIFLAMKTLIKTFKSGTNAIQLLNRHSKPFMQINYNREDKFTFIDLKSGKDITCNVLAILKTDY